MSIFDTFYFIEIYNRDRKIAFPFKFIRSSKSKNNLIIKICCRLHLRKSCLGEGDEIGCGENGRKLGSQRTDDFSLLFCCYAALIFHGSSYLIKSQ